jgi:hypothetical protein
MRYERNKYSIELITLLLKFVRFKNMRKITGVLLSRDYKHIYESFCWSKYRTTIKRKKFRLSSNPGIEA